MCCPILRPITGIRASIRLMRATSMIEIFIFLSDWLKFSGCRGN